MKTLFETDLKDFKLIKRGKVRDIYEVDDEHLLIVATDRLSAFDVILPDPVPFKGAVLTALSNFWFIRTAGVIGNHVADTEPWNNRSGNIDLASVKGRAIISRKAEPVMIEAVVRGYLSGSGWQEYGKTGSLCGIKLAAGLKESDRLPEPLFTPSTKAEIGAHDENISFEKAVNVAGRETAVKVRDTSLKLYTQAAAYARERGIIIADTKFEFGIVDGTMIVIDEMLTPDSSRFWPLEGYAPGKPQPSFDKQFVRDYLISVEFNRKPPAPKLPPDIIAKTSEKYREALKRLAPGVSLD